MLRSQIAPLATSGTRTGANSCVSTRPGSQLEIKCHCHSRGHYSQPLGHADSGSTGHTSSWLAPTSSHPEDFPTVSRSLLVDKQAIAKQDKPHKLHLSPPSFWLRPLARPILGTSPPTHPAPSSQQQPSSKPIAGQLSSTSASVSTATPEVPHSTYTPPMSVAAVLTSVSTITKDSKSDTVQTTVICVGKDSPDFATVSIPQLVADTPAQMLLAPHAPTSPPPSTAMPQGQPSSLLASLQLGLQALLRSFPHSTASTQNKAAQAPLFHDACSPDKLWALTVLSSTYVHQAATGFAIPVMLPTITMSLELSDLQGALLTSGYTIIYALALVPAGIMADKTRSRPALLGAGVTAWSALALAASNAQGFTELMLARVGLAIAQSTQNVVCFSVIPDLFPKNKSTALALYNCAIYIGRGLMYLAFNGARSLVGGGTGALGIQATAEEVIRDPSGNLLVPLEKLDLRLVQLVYTSGDMAAIRATTPLYFLPETLEAEVAAGLADHSIWRNVLGNLTIPGLLLGAALFLSVQEPEQRRRNQPFSLPGPLRKLFPRTVTDTITNTTTTHSTTAGGAAAAVLLQAAAAATTATGTVAATATTVATTATAAVASGELDAGAVIWRLMTSGPFLTTTLAAALNDVASYAMIAWQSTFYERVYDLSPEQYAPVLATLLPLCGIVGGVGGGLLSDRLALKGQRAWVTVATTMVAAPLIGASLTAPTPEESFLYLGLGFALSEAWRAPSAIMARSVVAPNQAATAMSLYLCIRNVIGGMGPIVVAQMAHAWGLQQALQILPGIYVASGMLFWRAEHLLAKHGAEIATASSTPSATLEN